MTQRQLMASLCGALAGLLLTATMSQAQDACAISYTRTACAGQEAESYVKCDGKVSCVQNEAAATAEECQAEALKACSNNRVNITKSKVITATFQGKPLKSATGNDDFCVDFAARADEYDKCDTQ